MRLLWNSIRIKWQNQHPDKTSKLLKFLHEFGIIILYKNRQVFW